MRPVLAVFFAGQFRSKPFREWTLDDETLKGHRTILSSSERDA
jgi:hypothetical protein